MTQDIDDIISSVEKILNDRGLLDEGQYMPKYNYQIDVTDHSLEKILASLKSQAATIAERDAEIAGLRAALEKEIEDCVIDWDGYCLTHGNQPCHIFQNVKWLENDVDVFTDEHISMLTDECLKAKTATKDA